MSRYTKRGTFPLEEILKKVVDAQLQGTFNHCVCIHRLLWTVLVHFIQYVRVGERGRYRLNPVTDGPAERAGVQNGDRLIWINGARIAALGYAALSKMVSALV